MKVIYDGKAIFTEDGTIRTHCTFRDISELDRVQHELWDMEERFRSVFNSGYIGITIAGFDFKYIDANPRFCEMIGYSKGELKQKTFTDITHPDDLDKDIAKARKLINGEIGRYHTEKRYIKKGGETLWADIGVSVVNGKIGSGDYFLAMIQDITEHKAAEKELRKSEKKYRKIFNNANDAIYLYEITDDGMPGKFVEVNDIACQMLGYSEQEFMDMTPRDIDNIETLEFLPAIMNNLMKNRRAKFQIEHKAKDGTIVPVEVSAHLMTLNNNKFGLSIVRNITEQVEAEIEAEERRKELQDLSDKLIRTQEKERKRLSRELHDELGQNMTGLSLNLSRIKNLLPKSIDKKIKESLIQSINIVDNLSKMTDRMVLDLRPPALDDLGLIPAIRLHVKEFEERTGIPVYLSTQNLDEQLPEKVATVVYRVAQEALTNIAKHAEADNVSLTISRKPGLLKITIEDDGAGFNPEGLEKRGLKNKGTGISSMRERLVAINGSLEISSEKDTGTTLVITAPLKNDYERD